MVRHCLLREFQNASAFIHQGILGVQLAGHLRMVWGDTRRMDPGGFLQNIIQSYKGWQKLMSSADPMLEMAPTRVTQTSHRTSESPLLGSK